MRLSVTQNVAEVLGLLPGQWCIVAPQERTGKQMRNNELPESLAWLPADGAGGEVPSSSRSPSSVKNPSPSMGKITRTSLPGRPEALQEGSKVR